MINCPSKLSFILCEGTLRLTKFNLMHNHEISFQQTSNLEQSLFEDTQISRDDFHKQGFTHSKNAYVIDTFHTSCLSERSNLDTSTTIQHSETVLAPRMKSPKPDNMMEFVDQLWDTQQ